MEKTENMLSPKVTDNFQLQSDSISDEYYKINLDEKYYRKWTKLECLLEVTHNMNNVPYACYLTYSTS